MNNKDLSTDSSLDTLQLIIKKLREKGPDFLDKEQMAVCLITVGFADVCKKLGVGWSQDIQKEFREKLRKLDFDIEWLDRKTPAELAPFLVHCARGDIAKIKQTIRKTPPEAKKGLIEATDAAKKSALHISSQEGFDALVDYFIAEKFKINVRDKELKTPLHRACAGGHQNVVHSLISNGADVYAKDFKGETPLHIAVRAGNSKIVTQLLDKIPRIVESKDFSGKTALHYAVVSATDGQVDVVRLLIEKGANVDEVDFDGRTSLHYACEYGKTRCIPILLKNKANLGIRDLSKNTPLDLASNQKVKKIIEAYSQQKLIISKGEQEGFRKEFGETLSKDQKGGAKQGSKITQSKIQDKKSPKAVKSSPNNLLLGGDTNQVSTWLREKFFVLMKKLQESGVKIRYHLKKPFIYTASWMEEIDNIEELFLIFRELTGPQVALRVFNILCPYEKKLPTGVSTIDAVEGFFGETWFSQGSTDKSYKAGKSEVKIQKQMEEKLKELEEYKLANLGYQSELERLEGKLTELNEELKQYKKIEDQVRKERVKNAKQYSQILKLTNELDDLRQELKGYEEGHDVNLSMQEKNQQLTKRNEQLTVEILALKSYEAAARRKCGKFFLKTLHNPIQVDANTMNNLYDDDAIIHLYELLLNNPPNLTKRLEKASKSGRTQLTVTEFNGFLEQLGMLPQDIMSMNRIVGFVNGRKLLAIEEFKSILKDRPQVRVEWERKLLGKIKSIIKSSEVGSAEKLFELLDKDGSHTLEIGELKQGLEEYNIYINQNDIHNLFSLLDADRSGQINLEELITLLDQGISSKKLPSQQEFDQQTPIPPPAETQRQDQSSHQNNSNANKSNRTPSQKSMKQSANRDSENKSQDQQKDKSISYNDLYQDAVEKNYSVTSEDLRDPELLKDMKEDDSEIVNGICKVQVLLCRNLPNQKNMNNVKIKVQFYDNNIVKIGDFSKTKWEIAVEIRVESQRKSWATPVRVSVYTERIYDEEHFLGMVEFPFQDIESKPNAWSINKVVPLMGHPDYKKQVSGEIGLQIKWVPVQVEKEEEQGSQKSEQREGEQEGEQGQEGEGEQAQDGSREQKDSHQEQQNQGTDRQNQQAQQNGEGQEQKGDQEDEPPQDQDEAKDDEDNQDYNQQFDAES